MWDDGCWMTDVFVVTLSAEAVVEYGVALTTQTNTKSAKFWANPPAPFD